MHKQMLSSHGVKSLKVAIGLLQSRGIATRDCLRGTGVAEADLGNLDLRIGLQQELTFYRNILALTGDPLIGLRIGAQYRLPNYGIWGYAVMSAPDLRAALTLAFRFLYLTYTCHDISLETSAKRTALKLVPLRDYEECSQIITDRDTSALFHLASEMLGRTLPLQKIDFIHRGTRYRREYRAYFGCPVDFGNDSTELHLPPAVLGETLPHSDPSTARLTEHQCELLVAGINQRPGVSNEVQQLIRSRPGRFPSIDEIARSMGRSPRSLRRQLTDEGHSYSGLVNEMRYQLAREYLEVTPLSMQQIAQSLGYSEPSNFTHAFKRWSGVSPQAYRNDFVVGQG